METFDNVIVGGTIVGASVAYHLACKSAGSVLLLERNELAKFLALGADAVSIGTAALVALGDNDQK